MLWVCPAGKGKVESGSQRLADAGRYGWAGDNRRLELTEPIMQHIRSG